MYYMYSVLNRLVLMGIRYEYPEIGLQHFQSKYSCVLLSLEQGWTH